MPLDTVLVMPPRGTVALHLLFPPLRPTHPLPLPRPQILLLGRAQLLEDTVHLQSQLRRPPPLLMLLQFMVAKELPLLSKLIRVMALGVLLKHRRLLQVQLLLLQRPAEMPRLPVGLPAAVLVDGCMTPPPAGTRSPRLLRLPLALPP